MLTAKISGGVNGKCVGPALCLQGPVALSHRLFVHPHNGTVREFVSQGCGIRTEPNKHLINII